jgi:dTDP-4-dehydrorhamnose 3,5-epimerase
MNITSTHIAGVFISEPKKIEDKRGFFYRGFCRNELKKAGVNIGEIVQINHSFSRKKGTFRGLHYQRPPYSEEKIVSCLEGSVLDIAVDLRKGSPTFLQHVSVELSPLNCRSFIIPKGCAHGFITLEENCRLLYLHTEYYEPSWEGGCSVHDPLLQIQLPVVLTELSDRDKNHPYLSKDFTGIEI